MLLSKLFFRMRLSNKCIPNKHLPHMLRYKMPRKVGHVFLVVLLTLSATTNIVFAQETNDSTQVFENYIVHYSVFNSTFVQPEIASRYSITRGDDRVLINISVHDKASQDSVAATVSGSAKNLIQQEKPLTFKHIHEQYADYYIAPLRITNREVFHFKITIKPEDGEEDLELRFSKKLYTE